MRVLFVEPPKDVWFILGEYLAPPFGILTLASYLEAKSAKAEIEVVDCQVERLDWKGLERRVEAFQPDIVAPSGLATCNAYSVLRTAEIAKEVDPAVTTAVGGRHFTALADEQLKTYPEIDIVIRGEGEQTLVEITKKIGEKQPLSTVPGISFRREAQIIHTPDRPLMSNLDMLPTPGYHFVEEHMSKYYFTLMAGKDAPFAIIEGSRGCYHNCTYCSCWRFWRGEHRSKSPERIADELEQMHREYGSKFFWLADDNLGLGSRIRHLCSELAERNLADQITWFMQARCDDIVQEKRMLSKMRKAGNIWILVGLDSPDPTTLRTFRRNGIDKSNAKAALNLLRENDIFSQGTFIIGERNDSRESIKTLREYADWLDPDLATFMTLTPFPGTEIYEIAKTNGWIEDTNWNNYDMIHAIMPTEHLTKEEVQEELYECYRTFFGSWNRRYKGLFSHNEIKKRTYQFLARKAILAGLRSLF
jgi:anaerobic magnesium-protoporphyrin IX monomethyl ester cyclase